MDRTAVRDTLLATLATLIVLGAAVTGAVMTTPSPRDVPQDIIVEPTTTMATTPPPPPASGPPYLGWIMALLGILLAVLLIVGVIQSLSGVAASRRRREPPLPAPELLADGETITMAQTEQDEHEQRLALSTGSPRNGIVAVWVRLERAAHDAGFDRLPSETAADLVRRVLDGANVRPEAVATLADLYREARFSEHEITEEHRYEALEALWAIQQDLRAGSRR